MRNLCRWLRWQTWNSSIFCSFCHYVSVRIRQWLFRYSKGSNLSLAPSIGKQWYTSSDILLPLPTTRSYRQTIVLILVLSAGLMQTVHAIAPVVVYGLECYSPLAVEQTFGRPNYNPGLSSLLPRQNFTRLHSVRPRQHEYNPFYWISRSHSVCPESYTRTILLTFLERWT